MGGGRGISFAVSGLRSALREDPDYSGRGNGGIMRRFQRL